jgi:hypothetical protein
MSNNEPVAALLAAEGVNDRLGLASESGALANRATEITTTSPTAIRRSVIALTATRCIIYRTVRASRTVALVLCLAPSQP